MSSSIISLIPIIKDNFPALPVLRRDQITTWRMWSDPEKDEIDNTFSLRRWDEFSYDEIRKEYAALYFFSLKALLYFMPAYMRLIARDIEDADMVPDALVSSIGIKRRSFFHPMGVSPLYYLSFGQAEVVRSILLHIRDWWRKDGFSTHEVDEEILICGELLHQKVGLRKLGAPSVACLKEL